MFERLNRKLKSRFSERRRTRKLKAGGGLRSKLKKRKLKKFKWWLPLLIILPAAAGYIAWKHEVFDVSEVEVHGGRFTDKEALSSEVESKVLGESIFKVSPAELEQQVLEDENCPYIQRVHIEKYLPSKLSIRIEEREPLVCLVGKGVVDEKGEVFIEEECPFGLEQFHSKTEEIDLEQINSAFQIKEALVSSGYTVIKVSLKEYGQITVRIKPGINIEFSTNTERSIKNQAELFKYVYNALREGRRVSEIDVRFDKVVVKYAK